MNVEISYRYESNPREDRAKLVWERKENGRVHREGQLQSIESEIAGEELEEIRGERKETLEGISDAV